jgi:acetylornithine deacetylase/succinyl-diaminopimelate desuccinylase-like protein
LTFRVQHVKEEKFGVGRRDEELIRNLRNLIAINTVNPPGNEIRAARHLAHLAELAGLGVRVLEPVQDRGSIVLRVRGDGSGGGPLLLLGHLDVVPAEADRWTHDPFEAVIDSGYIYGRGVLDMKAMVAMSFELMLDLAREMQEFGLDPARDIHPELGRDVIFAATADEEAGGYLGVGWIVDNEPDLIRSDAALTEAGGIPIHVLGRRLYPIGVAEKGFHRFKISISGESGHASVPRPESTMTHLGRVLGRLSEPTSTNVVPLIADALRLISAYLPGAPGRRAQQASRGLVDVLELDCEEPIRSTLSALTRTTFTPTIVSGGVKENVIPGMASLIVDCRTLPGATPQGTEAELIDHLGPQLASFCEVETLSVGDPVEQPLDHPILGFMADALREADPEAIPVLMLASFFTDAKHLVRLHVPTYGFSPLQLGAEDGFVDLFHGDDERVAIEGLSFGLAVLDRVVRRYAGRPIAEGAR